MPSRIEESHQLRSFGTAVYAGEIWALVAIAMQTCEGKVGENCFSTVLPRDNVLYLKGCRVKV